jgi:hypothetical protein
MIIFDLRCSNEHSFEGWFHSADDFASQQDRQLVACPQCSSIDIRRVPSAVAIGSSRHTPPIAADNNQTSTAKAVTPSTAEILGMYRQLVSAVVATTEDVGKGFAEEARKIHYQEVPERAIRGQATRDEVDALSDEGILVFSIPKPGDEDLH